MADKKYYNDKEYGRVYYVEPNTVSSIERVSESQTENYELINPMEDYSIYVNLEVEVRGRTVRVNGGSEMKTYSMSWQNNGSGTTVNFMGGSKIPVGSRDSGEYMNSLTTNYTDIFISDINKKTNNRDVSDPTTEMFGISSIDISYRNYVVPEVTIEFVDVRGVSLFAQEEAAHNSEGYADTTVEGSFFKSFFAFPYPKFTLYVKGFYGEPVSYELTCSDFRARFDSNTGNFGATAKFLGYAFSFLSDISLASVIAAPYSDFLGSEYWDTNVANGEFSVIDVNGQKAPMMRFGDLMTKINQITQKAEELSKNSPAVQQKEYDENRRNRLNLIAGLYTSYSNQVKAAATKFGKLANICDSVVSVTDMNSASDIRGAVFMGFKDTFNGKTFADVVSDDGGTIHREYENLKNEVKNYNTSYNASLPFPLDMGSTSMKPDGIFRGDKNSIHIHSELEKKLKKYNATPLRNALVRFRDSETVKKMVAGAISGLDGFVFIDHRFGQEPFLDALSKERQKVSDNLANSERGIEDAVAQAITEALKFPPTVENFTRMLMAHFETLAYCIYRTSTIISSDNTKRTLSYLGLNLGDASDISGTETIVPPFPRVTHEVTEYGETKREDSWVGDYSGDFREKDLVHGLLNGVSEFSRLSENAKQGTVGSEPSSNTKATMAVPVAPSDFVATKDIYGDMGGFENNDELAAQLAMRAFLLMGFNNLTSLDPDDLGKFEAMNFAAKYPTPIGTLAAITGDANIVQALYDTLTNGGSHKWGDKSFIESDGNKIKLRFNTIKGKMTAIPYQQLASTRGAQMRNDMDSAVFKSGSEYITSDYQSGRTSENTFVFDKNIKRVNDIIQNQLSGGDFGKLKKLYANAEFNSDKIKTLFKDTERIKGMFTEESKHFESTEGSLLFPINASVGGNIFAFSGNGQTIDSLANGEINGNERNSDAFDEKYLIDLSTSEVSITEFYGVKDNGGGTYVFDGGKCLFGQKCYYSTKGVKENEVIYQRAYLFLTSLGGFGDGGFFNYRSLINERLIVESNYNIVFILPYVAILKLGADCWKSPNTAYTKIRKDVKDKFITEFKNWADSTYKEIDAQLAVFVNEEQYTEFMKGGALSDSNIRISLIERFSKNTKNPNAFFENYMTVSSGETDDKKNIISFGLMNRPSGVGIKDATEEILQMCTVVKMTNRFEKGKGAVSLSGDDLKEFFKGFVDKMKELYSSTTETQNTSNQINQAKEPEQNEKNIKIGVYKYCKLLYDKWLAGLSQEKFNSSYTMKKFFDGFDADGFGKMFHFVDSFYSLANDIFINIGSALEKMATAMDGNDDYSMISYFTDVLAENHLMLYCIQNFMDLSDKESLQNMFKPVPVISMRKPHDTPNFVIMYAGEPSSNLDMGANNEYKNDSYLLSVDDGKGGNEWPKALLSSRVGSMGGYTLPAFGVSYGKMYQSYFQDIDVGMDNPIVTEQSIKAQFNIASKNNEGEQSSNRDGHTLGQDLFTVYSNNSYTCTVKMMGCAWVQPLMYFCLNNVPMFRGTYLVTKVRHNIEPGNMTTTFEGVRMSNVRTRRVDSWLYRRKAMNNGVVNENQDVSRENLAADITNDCPYKAYPILTEGAGGNYGEPNLLGKVMGTVGQAPGNQLKDKWVNRNLKDSLCAMIRQEAGDDPQGQMFMTALVYNRLRARGNWSTILSKQFSSWEHKNTETWYNDTNVKSTIGKMIDNIFANGSAGILAGTVYTIDSEWKLDRNSNNAYKLKNGSNTLTPEQAAKLYFNGFLKEWNNEYNGADNYIRHKDCTLLCVIGGQAFCEDPSTARRLKVEAAPKALNDNTNKISPFAMGFYNAVQQTSHNSAIGVDFGVSNDKSKGLNLYISNGKKADKFAAVFDVIMNTPEYFSHVKKLMWITDQNSLTKAPVGFMVELTEQNYEENRQIGFSFNDGESLTDSKLTYTKESLNDAFVKGVIKHYANANDAALEIGCISKLDDMFKTKGDIAECSSIVQSSTPTGDLRGFAGTVTNERMKKVLSKVDYLCHGHQNKGQWYVVRGSNGTGFEQVKSGAGWCTFGPSTWYNEAGLDLHFWSNKINGRDVYLGPGGATFASSSGQIHSYGFECVYHSDVTNESKKYLNDRTHLRPGDLAIMFVGNPNSAHACMWTGNDWRSDFKQNNCWIYGGKPGRGEDGFHISLWRHPEFQEPGLPIT